MRDRARRGGGVVGVIVVRIDTASIPPRYRLDTSSIPPRWETSTRAVVRAGRRIIDIGIETGPRVGRRRASRRMGAVARSDG
jgi:hypothetical protein